MELHDLIIALSITLKCENSATVFQILFYTLLCLCKCLHKDWEVVWCMFMISPILYKYWEIV